MNVINVDEMIGKKFGTLTVIENLGKVKTEHRTSHNFLCHCECGKTKITDYTSLNTNHVKTCGDRNAHSNPRKDLVGKKYGMLTVIKCLGKIKRNTDKEEICWLCICECGNEYTTNRLSVKSKSCGCLSYKGRTPLDITGKKFGKLTAIKNTHEKNDGGNYIWEFLCDCGNPYINAAGNVIFGHTESCGCLKKENTFKTHDLSKSSEYKSWSHMKSRILNQNSPSYKRYGETGITIEEKWIHSFEAFIEHIGMKPTDGKRYTIDRINTHGNYEIGNVRWATDTEQSQNRTMLISNTSGINGVFIQERQEIFYAIATWSEFGRRKSKSFSYEKYGESEAFKLACEHRTKIIEELNDRGASYTKEHGLPKL